MRWVGHIAHMGERRGIYRVLVGKTEGKETIRKTQVYIGGSSGRGLREHGLDRSGSR